MRDRARSARRGRRSGATAFAGARVSSEATAFLDRPRCRTVNRARAAWSWRTTRVLRLLDQCPRPEGEFGSTPRVLSAVNIGSPRTGADLLLWITASAS
jgi:hypothetical protein